MECHCLGPAETPHTTKLYATFLEDFGRLAEFYSHPPTEEGLLRAARAVPQDAEKRRAVAELLREQNRSLGADGETQSNIARLAAGAVAVVTGQQVGLFTGPAYSIYKALTALRIAQQLTERGTDAVPVFWLAAEDHDLAEVNHCEWPGREGLARLEIAPEDAGGKARSVGRVQLGEGILPLVERAAAQLEGPMAEEVGAALAASYGPTETFGTAFGKFVARLFAGKGIILLDSLDARWHRLAGSVYRRALADNDNLIAGLLARSKQLDRAGYHAQVKVTERSTLLFLDVEGERLPVRRRNNGFAAGSQEISAKELLAAAEESPERFSANVLLRPIIQDYLLPTAGYVGGPAEVAYFAQAEVAYRRLLGRMPAILPRAGFTLVEPHVARLLKKYKLELRDVFRGRQHLRGRLERGYLSKELARQFSGGEKKLRQLLRSLRNPLGKLDKTLIGALDTAEQKMLYQFLHLRDTAGRAQNSRTGVLDTHERILTEALYPHHGLQERTLCFLPFLARHGAVLLDELGARASLGASQHQVLYL
jgi:bacillithiol biosynthesis cysteine-adding enzyme BshC